MGAGHGDNHERMLLDLRNSCPERRDGSTLESCTISSLFGTRCAFLTVQGIALVSRSADEAKPHEFSHEVWKDRTSLQNASNFSLEFHHSLTPQINKTPTQ